MMQKTWKVTESLAHGYSPESASQKLSNEYQHDRVLKKSLFSCASDKSSLSIGIVDIFEDIIPGKKHVLECDPVTDHANTDTQRQ